MKETIKALSLGLRVAGFKNLIQQNIPKNKLTLDWSDSSALEPEEVEGLLRANDISIIEGPVSLGLDKIVKHRSVGSHFLNYIDFVVNDAGMLWGHSTFSQAYLDLLRQNIKSQDFKGSAIFLGSSYLVPPAVHVLAKFGFNDFVFLDLEGESGQRLVESSGAGLLGVKTSTVNSQAFVQSQKEYSMCLVMEDQYSSQTLEDMSYFHFLSNHSMVFDLSGRSNFLFDEVAALGVRTLDFAEIQSVRAKHYALKVQEVAGKLG